MTELYLHRNYISSFSNSASSLRNISQVQILWLSQNHLKTLPHNLFVYLSDLRELRIESNNISSLDFFLSLNGIDESSSHLHDSTTSLNGSSKQSHHHPLTKVGLSGNPIHDIKELLKLKSFYHLAEVLVQDVHYGKCPILYNNKTLQSPLHVAMDEIDDEFWYRDFFIVHLPRVKVLDGIKIPRDRIDQVRRSIQDEVTSYFFIETVP